MSDTYKTVFSNPSAGNKDGVVPVGSIVYKAVRYKNKAELSDYISGVLILKMVILGKSVVPKESRANIKYTDRKCRAEKVYILSAHHKDNEKVEIDTTCLNLYSDHNIEFKYTVGTVVTPHRFDNSPDETCTAGIHFFRTFKEAALYM